MVAPLQALIRLLRNLVESQTKIELHSKHSDHAAPDSLFIENDSTGMGLLVFGLTTRSRHPVELLRIEIDYSVPLQLLDPKKMGFFQAGGSNDEDFPFRLYSDEGCQLHSNLIHVFALITQFPPDLREFPVRITVHARTLGFSANGIETCGRKQITRRFYRVVLADDRLLGIKIPPEHFLTTIQPFLIQCGLTASEYGNYRPTSDQMKSSHDIASRKATNIADKSTFDGQAREF